MRENIPISPTPNTTRAATSATTSATTSAMMSTGTRSLDELVEPLRLLREVSLKLEKYTKLQKELQAAIKAHLGLAEVGTVAGLPVVTWKRTLRVAVSQKLLKQRYPELVSEVSDITEVRTFKVLDQ